LSFSARLVPPGAEKLGGQAFSFDFTGGVMGLVWRGRCG